MSQEITAPTWALDQTGHPRTTCCQSHVMAETAPDSDSLFIFRAGDKHIKHPYCWKCAKSLSSPQ